MKLSQLFLPIVKDIPSDAKNKVTSVDDTFWND
jgi:hypothetical protein